MQFGSHDKKALKCTSSESGSDCTEGLLVTCTSNPSELHMVCSARQYDCAYIIATVP